MYHVRVPTFSLHEESKGMICHLVGLRGESTGPPQGQRKKIRTRSVSNKNVPTFGCGERLVGRERLTKFNPPAPRQPLILPIRDALRQSNGISGARRGKSVAIIVSREEEVAAWEKEAPDRCPWFWQLQHHSIPCMHADIDCCMPLAIELK